MQPGATYGGDRYFAEDYKMFGRLQTVGCQFVLRLRDEAVVQVEAEIPLSSQDPAAGILSDQWVRLGCKKRYRTERLRVIRVRKPSGTVMRLISNVELAEMSARDIQTLYRRRWQIECFFRWIKCLLGCRHWLAESPEGVATQLHLAVIAGLLLQLVLGRRLDKRLLERLQFQLIGWTSAEELLQAVKAAVEKAGAKKTESLNQGTFRRGMLPGHALACTRPTPGFLSLGPTFRRTNLLSLQAPPSPCRTPITPLSALRWLRRKPRCVTSSDDPTAHAEIVAIRDACRRLKTFQLDD